MTAARAGRGPLAGKVALVTGAGRNIGAGIARRLAADGATVAVHYSASASEAQAVADGIAAAGGSAFLLKADLLAPAGIDALAADLERALAARGFAALDILVNNAAVILEGGDEIALLTEADFDRVIGTNLKAPFLLVRKLAPRIADGGRIVNLSSRPSTVAFPKGIAYAMAKSALNSLTRSLAKELGPRGITVNALAPGVIETDRTVPRLLATTEARAFVAASTALKRIGRIDDVADAVAFLVSNDARWITGAYIEAAGGAGL